jgi:hypothetical protein
MGNGVGRKCQVCEHKLMRAIEGLAIKDSCAASARCYGVSVNSLRRHMLVHAHAPGRSAVYLPPAIEDLALVPGAVVVEDQEPITIPNAYRQLDELRLMQYAIIKAPPIEGKDGKDPPEWLIVQDKQYRLGAMRELRATIAATLKLWEAQRALEERYSGARPLTASTIAAFLRSKYPDVLLELVEHLKQQRIAV